MCKGRLVRFLCPEALNGNPLCPHLQANGVYVPYGTMWHQTSWVCCGDHSGDCSECPRLRARPENVTIYDAVALECDPCGARLRAERAAGVQRWVSDVRESVEGPDADGLLSEFMASSFFKEEEEKEEIVEANEDELMSEYLEDEDEEEGEEEEKGEDDGMEGLKDERLVIVEADDDELMSEWLTDTE